MNPTIKVDEHPADKVVIKAFEDSKGNYGARKI